MPDIQQIPTRTFDQLAELAVLAGADLVAVQRGAGPAQATSISALIDYITANIGAIQGAKGDPGGNVMAVSSFEALPGLAISVGTDQIITSSWGIGGNTGGARYVLDTDQVSATVTRFRKKSSNDRWFTIAENIVTVAMLGGIASVSATPSAMPLADVATLANNNATLADWLSLSERAGLYIDAYYQHDEPLLCETSVTIGGCGGREHFDNSFDRAGDLGACLHFVGGEIDDFPIEDGRTPPKGSLTLRTPFGDGGRVKIVLDNFSIRGAMVVPGAATSGKGLVIDGRQDLSSSAHLITKNVNSAEARDEGVYIAGAVYGFRIEFMGCHRNGKNGFRTRLEADGIGEGTISGLRSFQNGQDGAATEDERTGAWVQSGASVFITQTSCSENSGGGLILQGGSYAGGGVQCESNQGSFQIKFGSEGGGLGVTSAVLNGIMCSPGAGYTGTTVNISSDANRVILNGAFFGDTLGAGGKDVFIAGALCEIRQVTATHTFVYQDVGGGNVVAPSGVNLRLPAFLAFNTAPVANVSGANNAYTVVYDTEDFDQTGSLNAATGIFTAAVAGPYHFDVSVALSNLDATHLRGNLELVTSNRTVAVTLAGLFAIKTDTGRAPAPALSQTVWMDAGDTAFVQVTLGDGPATATLHTAYFSGHLVKG